MIGAIITLRAQKCNVDVYCIRHRSFPFFPSSRVYTNYYSILNHSVQH